MIHKTVLILKIIFNIIIITYSKASITTLIYINSEALSLALLHGKDS